MGGAPTDVSICRRIWRCVALTIGSSPEHLIPSQSASAGTETDSAMILAPIPEIINLYDSARAVGQIRVDGSHDSLVNRRYSLGASTEHERAETAMGKP